MSIMAAPNAAMSAGGAPEKNPAMTRRMTRPGLTRRTWSTVVGSFGIWATDGSRAEAHEQQIDDQPVEEQPHQRDRAESPEKLAIGDAGERANQHVLRVAGDGRHASDVRRRGDREEIRQRIYP